MFQALARFIQSQPDKLDAFLAVEHAVFDWTRLGLFTGSCVAEYAQTRLKANDRYNTIPTTLDAGDWAGQALAFLREDFTFYNAQHKLISISSLHQTYLHGTVTGVHIRFRFDKSPRNFSIGKFQGTDDPLLDPVAAAAVSCIHLADLLQIASWEPIGAFEAVNRSPAFL
jgi:hypothetical protein